MRAGWTEKLNCARRGAVHGGGAPPVREEVMDISTEIQIDRAELERRVVTEWLPTSGYEYAEGPDVEVYLDPERTRFEVWIPVAKAKG